MTTMKDAYPRVQGIPLPEGLVPVERTPDGVQLLARVAEGEVREWIVTTSARLERVLGHRQDWRLSVTAVWLLLGEHLPPFLDDRGEGLFDPPRDASLPEAGLVPWHVTPGGLQLWIRVREGRPETAIVTHGEVLERLLRDQEGWRCP
jgi:hypothetical protein